MLYLTPSSTTRLVWLTHTVVARGMGPLYWQGWSKSCFFNVIFEKFIFRLAILVLGHKKAAVGVKNT
jgi:hypothetical protein